MNINERLKDLLQEKGKTQKELADFIGVRPNTVSDWLIKGKNPSANYSYRFCDFFMISMDYLYMGKDCVSHNLSEVEVELLETYKKLDSRGQHRLHTIIYEELDRMEENKNISSSQKAIS